MIGTSKTTGYFPQWLGYYYETDSEWIYSITLGWLYDTPNSLPIRVDGFMNQD